MPTIVNNDKLETQTVSDDQINIGTDVKIVST